MVNIKTSSKIKVKFPDNVVVEIDTDTPNLQELIKICTEIPNLDVNSIDVSYEFDTFDTEVFKEAIKEAINDFRVKIKIEEDSIKKIIKEFEPSKKSGADEIKVTGTCVESFD
jgi:predicted component of type VI protein secretion system